LGNYFFLTLETMKKFYISEGDFRVWLPEVQFIEKGDEYNSRKIRGIMSTQRIDRQGESVVAKGLEFDDFLHHGHFNDNHSQETSAIVGYPETVKYHKSMKDFGLNAEGWTCEGFVIKGTKRSDGIWELANALAEVPNRKLGFSIEGKVIRRSDKTIEKARIRNVAITNCPVNTDCTWEVLDKSFASEEVAMKSMMAGYGASPGTQTGGGAMRGESLDSDEKVSQDEKKKKRVAALKKALLFDDMEKAMQIVLERRPDMDEEAAAYFVNYLFKKGGML